jgi:hypothetical protein
VFGLRDSIGCNASLGLHAGVFYSRGYVCERNGVFAFRACDLEATGKHKGPFAGYSRVGSACVWELSAHSGVKGRLSYCFGFPMMAVSTYDR